MNQTKTIIALCIICLLSILVYPYSSAIEAKNDKLPDTSGINKLLDRSYNFLLSNEDSAYFFANKALTYSISKKYNKGIADSYIRIGYVMYYKGINDSALYYFRKALFIRNILKDKKAIAASCYSLSNVFQSIDSKDSAFYYQFIAVKLNEQLGDSVRIAKSYTSLGNLFNSYKDSINSLLYYTRSLRIYKNIHDTVDIAFGYSGLGIYYYGIKKETIALKYFFQAKEMDEKLNNTESLSGDYSNIALCYKSLHDNEKALLYYRKSLTISENMKETQQIATDYTNIGILYVDKQQTDSAIFYFREGIDLSRKVADENLLLLGYQSLSYAYVQKGDYKNAFDYNLKYSALNDTILNEGKIKQIADMQTKYETGQKNDEIQILNQQNKIDTAQRKLLVVGWGVLLLVFGGSIYFFMQRQKTAKKKANLRVDELLREQEIKAYNAMLDGQENERYRIASDLHDRVGSMLATVKMHFSALNENNKLIPEQNLNQYKRANTLLDEAVNEVRKISHNLNTGVITSFGLLSALQELCESVEISGKIKCKLLAFGIDGRLDNTTEITIYRIVQEIFSNILKHANAKNITVQLSRADGILTIMVEDDGIGFDTKDKLKSDGMGLKSIKTRAEKLKGSFVIDSTPGNGAVAILELQLNTAQL